MKVLLCTFLLIQSVFLQAEDGHNLWLRAKSSSPVNVICSKKSATIDIARKELQQGWLGKAEASVVLNVKPDKTIKGDGFKLTLNGVQANNDL